MKAGLATTAALALGLGAAAYLKVVCPWYRHWGATEEEISRSMPLDEYVPDATATSTRAVTIRAGPERIWPWLAQMGEPPRAGYYSYTWIERMQGMKITNVDRVLSDFRTLQAGDKLDERGDMTVLAVEPGRYLVLGPPEHYSWLKSTWAFAMFPQADGSTRLVTRVRARVRLRAMFTEVSPLMWPLLFVLDPGAFIMERKMLLRIKELAERGAATSPFDRAPAGISGNGGS